MRSKVNKINHRKLFDHVAKALRPVTEGCAKKCEK